MSGPTTRWWLVRHAPVQAAGRIYGQLDLAADTSDGAAADALARRLPQNAVWLTTQLQRTPQTAEAILSADAAALEPASGIIPVPDLAEQHFGEWQGRHVNDVMRDEAQVWEAFWKAPATSRPPGGESFRDVVARVGAALSRLSADYAGRDIVAVAHGGSIRAALATALKLDSEAALSFSMDTWSLTRMDHIANAGRDGGAAWRIVAVNLPPVETFK